MKKWFRISRLAGMLRKTWRLLRMPQVPFKEKLFLLVPALLYWVLPDAIPFMPLDDIAVTLLLAGWFTGRLEKKYLP